MSSSSAVAVSTVAATFYALRAAQKKRAAEKPAPIKVPTSPSRWSAAQNSKHATPMSQPDDRSVCFDDAAADEVNPKPHENITDSSMLGTNGDRLVIVMVGLPGRGKTFIARKIAHYLTFFHGAPCEVFNLGEYRRRHFAGKGQQAPDFFDPNNADIKSLRDDFAKMAMADLKTFLGSDTDSDNPSTEMGRVAIFDGTNTTGQRRQWTLDELMRDGGVPSSSHVLFVESVCDDETILNNNYQAKVGWLVGWLSWLGWLVGWVGVCVRACMSFVHPFALSFGRSLSTSLSLSISLLLPISLTRGSVIAQLGARVSRYTAASWVLSNAGLRQALRQPGIVCASAPGQARRQLVVKACRVGHKRKYRQSGAAT
jgi:hypothetical protein